MSFYDIQANPANFAVRAIATRQDREENYAIKAFSATNMTSAEILAIPAASIQKVQSYSTQQSTNSGVITVLLGFH